MGLPQKLSGLADLAMNLWWSWHPAGRELFQKIDRLEWEESGHNPIKMLRDLPEEVLESISRDPYFR
ncbi:MAG: DUF3417 domain-containing protein [Methanotrichaceae archaeon]|nr:DUF3417 domain-containing protein [Methanotrichaceae archaeon]